jgi:nitrogen-specific signal transduction histidine kinase
MDAHTLEHAFDPFFSAKPAGRQAGLGLAKARRLIEALGGDVQLDSQPQAGATASLSVPLTDPPKPSDASREKDETSASAPTAAAMPVGRGENRAYHAH